jgi:hypothetical protein
MQQIYFAYAEYADKRNRRERFLSEMGKVVFWKGLIALIEPQPSYPLMTMLRVHLMQNWFRKTILPGASWRSLIEHNQLQHDLAGMLFQSLVLVHLLVSLYQGLADSAARIAHRQPNGSLNTSLIEYH